jgi:hypothetical protein
MPPTNYDSSELTRRRNAVALAAFSRSLESARASGNIYTSRTEQPSFQVLTVVTERKIGGCLCTDTMFYRRNVGATCGSCS